MKHSTLCVTILLLLTLPAPRAGANSPPVYFDRGPSMPVVHVIYKPRTETASESRIIVSRDVLDAVHRPRVGVFPSVVTSIVFVGLLLSSALLVRSVVKRPATIIAWTATCAIVPVGAFMLTTFVIPQTGGAGADLNGGPAPAGATGKAILFVDNNPAKRRTVTLVGLASLNDYVRAAQNAPSVDSDSTNQPR